MKYNLTDVKLTDEILTELENAIIKTYEQGERSLRDTDCAYRGEGGLCCLVGHIIRDEEYDEVMDVGALGTSYLCDISTDINIPRFVKYKQEVTEFDRVLYQLQGAHDEAIDGSLKLTFRTTFLGNLIGRIDGGKLPEQLRKVVTSLQSDLED